MRTKATNTKATKANTILSLGKKVQFELSKDDTSRVKGDFQARFCERLAGETPACLLGGNFFYQIGHRTHKGTHRIVILYVPMCVFFM